MKKVALILLFVICLFSYNAMAIYTPRIAVIFPTDETNINSVGNVVNCMVRAVFDERKKNGKLFEYDIFNDARDVVQTAKISEIISQKKYDVAIGTTLSSQALIVSKILNQSKIPFFAPLATHPEVVEGKQFSSRLPFSDRQQAKALARFSIKSVKKISSILIINNQSLPYSTFLSEKYQEEILKENPEIKIKKVTYIDGKFNKDDIISIFQEIHYDIVFAPIYSLDVANTYAAIVSVIKSPTILISSDTVGAKGSFITAMGKQNSLLKFFFVQHNPKNFSGPFANNFKKLFENKCGKYQLTMNAAAGFDLANATLNAVFSPRYNGSSESFIQELRTQKYKGVLGDLIFNANGESIKPIHIYSIQGKSVIYKESIF